MRARGRDERSPRYDRHAPAGKNGEHSRNAKRSKTVVTDVGPVEIEVPRDRDGSFEPGIVKKRQRRLNRHDDITPSRSVASWHCLKHRMVGSQRGPV
ncbi:transposase [Streptomyces sp. NPDC048362]|uniref:transposase n=1 Tax=Streptomyces sp. NPDC048362 TaxID=3365539 RepID=UPI00371E33D9